jgi:sugar-specific transcriptional regulator TrmB
MRVSTLGRQHTGRPLSTHAKFPAPCLPVTWEESLQAVAGRTLENYKDEVMSISQTLFDAIQKLEAELEQPDEYGVVLAQEIASLIERMKDVQRKLDQELTEIDKLDE